MPIERETFLTNLYRVLRTKKTRNIRQIKKVKHWPFRQPRVKTFLSFYIQVHTYRVIGKLRNILPVHRQILKIKIDNKPSRKN